MWALAFLNGLQVPTSISPITASHYTYDSNDSTIINKSSMEKRQEFSIIEQTCFSKSDSIHKV